MMRWIERHPRLVFWVLMGAGLIRVLNTYDEDIFNFLLFLVVP
jgi:hypothetical protein